MNLYFSRNYQFEYNGEVLYSKLGLMRDQRFLSSPSIPNPADAASAGMKGDLANFPFMYQINALAQEGGKATINGKEYDFTGLGNADQSAQISDQMAQTLLDIQKNYAPGYIKQRLADLEQSDPQGFAARKQLFSKIIEDSEKAPANAKMSSDLQGQVNGMLSNAGRLDERGLEQVQQGVRGGQVARGIFLGNAPESQEASAVVNASDTLKQQQQDEALKYLQSGISPQDIEFRKVQQDLANLGAFQNNQTPTAQFGQLSGAQQGAAPFNPVNYSVPYALNPEGSAQAGINFANAQYGYQNSQANPWLAGLSLGANAFGAGANLYSSLTSNPALTSSQWSSFNAGAGPVASSYAGNVNTQIPMNTFTTSGYGQY